MAKKTRSGMAIKPLFFQTDMLLSTPLKKHPECYPQNLWITLWNSLEHLSERLMNTEHSSN